MTDYNEYKSHLTEFETKHAPEKLYTEGHFDLLVKGRRISVVGSRKVSEKGKIRAKKITEILVHKGFIVVSGLASGVDTIAHQTTINNEGKTITVLGTPLSKTYPKENESLLKEIKENHLAISQFPEKYPFRRANFPIRNRTMALISDATIIIEASEKSGTRHQGWEALRLGRSLLILESVLNESNISWAKEMVGYGAQIINRNNIDDILDNVPYLTNKEEYAF